MTADGRTALRHLPIYGTVSADVSPSEAKSLLLYVVARAIADTGLIFGKTSAGFGGDGEELPVPTVSQAQLTAMVSTTDAVQ